MPGTVFHAHTATTPDITNLSYDILPQRDWNATHAVTLNLVGSEVQQAFTNQGNVTFGIGNAGAISATCAAVILSAGSAIASQGTVSFGNSNGVTFGLNGSTITASIGQAPPSLTLSAGTNTAATGTVAFVNSNGVTAGMDPFGNITFTVQPGPAAGVGGLAAGTQIFTSGTVSFQNANSVSFGLAGSVLTASVSTIPQSVQSQNLHDLTIGGNVSGVPQLVSSGTLTLAGGPNITLSQAGYAISVSGNPAQTVQTQNLHDLSISGNVAGSPQLVSSGTAILVGGANVTLSQNGQSINILAAGAGGAAIAGIAGSNGTYITGTVVFSNSNGVSFGTAAGNAITASYTVPNVPVVPAALSGSGGSITSGTAIFSNSNNVTVGFNGQTITLSAGPAYDITLAGNTTGTLALISSGTLTLAGGANITLSQNGNAVTISGNAGGGGGNFSAGLSNIGNTLGNTGTVSNQIVLAGGNNITLSGSTAAGGMTVTVSGAATAPSVGLSAGTQSVNSGTVNFANSNGVSFGMSGSSQITASVAAQSAQTLGMYAESNTTGQSSSLAIDARSLSFNFAGLSGGFSGGSVLISNSQTNQALTFYALSNTVGQSSSSTFNATNVSHAFGGNVSGGFSNGSFLISGSQSAQALGLYLSSQTFGASSSSTIDARSFSIEFLGAAQGGLSAGTLQISASTVGGLTSGGFYAAGNTTGQSSSSTLPLTSLNISGAGAISLGLSSNSLIISAPGTVALTQFSGGMSTQGNTAGTTGLATAQMVLVGTGAISLSQSTNGGSVTISINGGGGNLTAYATSNTTQQSSGTIAGSSFLVQGNGAISAGVSNGSLVISGPAASSLFAAGNVTLSTNGNSITISGSSPYLSFFQAVPFDNSTVFQAGNGTIQVYPVFQPEAFAATRGDIFMSGSFSTSSNSSYAGTISAAMGLYTRNGSTLSLATSGSQSYAFTMTSNNSTGNLNLVRRLSVPIAVNFPGNLDLWVAVQTITSTANTNWFTLSNVGISSGPSVQIGLLGAATNNTNQIMPGLGFWSATSANLPGSMAFSHITGGNNTTQMVPLANFVNVSF